MSKVIKMTPEMLKGLCEEFFQVVSTTPISDGKISFNKTLASDKKTATLSFTEKAWQKMQTLIREFDKEVAWHGVAKRDENEENGFIISDILVYPQEVTGATVNTDQAKYEMWLMSHDDEVFNNIRMQGHSHVNMGTSPSSVDLEHQRKIIEQLDDSMFYIFVIWNKRNEKTIKIYDFANNTLYETSDVTVKVLEEDDGLEKFIKEAKELVADKPANIFSNTSQSRFGSGYNGYGSYGGYGGYFGKGDYDDLYEDDYPQPYGSSSGAYSNSGSSKSSKKDGKKSRKGHRVYSR